MLFRPTRCVLGCCNTGLTVDVHWKDPGCQCPSRYMDLGICTQIVIGKRHLYLFFITSVGISILTVNLMVTWKLLQSGQLQAKFIRSQERRT